MRPGNDRDHDRHLVLREDVRRQVDAIQRDHGGTHHELEDRYVEPIPPPSSSGSVTPDSAPTVYCRFGKRDLDKTSWVAPLLNNRFGDLFNLELRHEQLFFIQGERVLEDVGYSEKGRRFSEAEFGKPIRSLDELRKHGYWLAGRTYEPEVMREALRRQRDGYYYSFFSNQCQDWADRLKRAAERVERERGIAGPGLGERSRRERPTLPTEPASIWLGLVAIALGVGAAFAPIVAGGAFTTVIGAFFVASGLSHVVYGLHARDWRNLLHEVVLALISIAAGALMLGNRELARTTGSVIVAVTLGTQGIVNVTLSLFSRPRSHWGGKLIAGLLMIAGAALVASRWPVSGERMLGMAVGVAFMAGGVSTIALSWLTRTRDDREVEGER